MYGLEQRTYITVGAITLIAVILLIGGITIGRGLNVSLAPVQVRIRAATAAGLEAGAPVWINGIKRGSVLTVKQDGDSVLIIAGIDDASMLRADARARIAMLELTGGKRLDILPGSSSERWHNQTLRVEQSGDLADVVTTLSMLAPRLGTLLARLDSAVAAVNSLLSSPMFQSNLQTTAANAAQLSTELRDLVARNRAAVEETIDNLHTLSSQLRQTVGQTRPTVERIIERLDRISAELEQVVTTARLVTRRADTTLTELERIAQQLRSERTLLGKLLYDERFASELEAALRRIGGLVDTISRYGVNVNVRLGTRP